MVDFGTLTDGDVGLWLLDEDDKNEERSAEGDKDALLLDLVVEVVLILLDVECGIFAELVEEDF